MTYTILDGRGNVFTISADGQFETVEQMLDTLLSIIIGRAIAQKSRDEEG